MSSVSTIDELRASLGQPQVDPAYAVKQLHAVPTARVVKRQEFVLERCAGKRVLEFGASGPMHEALKTVASEYFGVDRLDNGSTVKGFDLDDTSKDYLPSWSQTDFVRLDWIVCGEVLEHLSNPGWFLQRLRKQFSENPQHEGIRVLITVPNAFSDAGRQSLQGGIENVNRDHVAWYSYKTLLTLVTRAGYDVKDFAWYNGKPLTAEGLIFVVG